MTDLIPSVEVDGDNYSVVASRLRGSTLDLQAERTSQEIVSGVRALGDKAVVDYVKRFDKVNLEEGELRVPPGDILRADRAVEPAMLGALRFLLRRLKAVQGRLLSGMQLAVESGGFKVSVSTKPLASVGCYIPGGRASYASTVLMTAGVARLAGVPRVVICTPASADGRVNPSIMAAAKLCGVTEMYRVGGSQAVAALAYGTRTIPRVDKIVGPGGSYVAIAKRIVARDVEIDFFAGPTELVVLADDSADPRLVAWDLVAQAEHGGEGFCGLVTYSESHAEEVRSSLREILTGVERRAFVEGTLRRGFAAICDNKATAVSLVNTISPEHLEIITRDQDRLAQRIDAAGLKLLGPYAPSAASDYCVGTDHVIPTGGFARSRGCLSVLDFVKLEWTVRGSRNGLGKVIRPLELLAAAEGLPNHYLSVKARLPG